MTDPRNEDGTAPDWETRKWGAQRDLADKHGWCDVCAAIFAGQHVCAPKPPSPMDAAFAVVAEQPQRVGSWLVVGTWKYRLFGREIQLRNKRLPHIAIDVWRVEAEALFRVLGEVLGRPAPLPYRTPWHERLRQWWMRAVWNRKNARELDEYRAERIRETLASMPQIGDEK